MAWFKSGSYVLLTLLCLIVKLEAQSLKFLSTPKSPVYTKIGENLILNITYEYNGTNKVGITWLLGTTRLVVKSPDNGKIRSIVPRANITGEGNLFLKNVIRADDGTFEVRLATYDVKDEVKTFVVVFVQEKPTAILNCLNITIMEGETISCWCNSTDGNPPPMVTWYKDDTVINGSGYLKQQLLVKNASAEDSGIYNCTAQSHDLTDTKLFHVLVKYKPRITYFKINQTDGMYVGLNSPVTIICKADAYPAAKYTLSHNDKTPLTGDDNVVYKIISVKSSDAGIYACQASNEIGNATKSFKLEIKMKPKAIVNCQDTVNESDNFTCVCNSSGGNPPPTARWTKDGTSDEINGVGSLTKELVFYKINRTDKGKYWCKVNSLDLIANVSIFITVQYKPNIKCTPNGTQSLHFNTSTNLICIADGLPAANVTLLHKGKRLQNNYTKVKHHIPYLNEKSTGIYTATAINIVGNDTEIIDLVATKPTTPPSTTRKPSSGDKEKQNTGLIIGAAAGGVALVAILITVICCCCCPEKCCFVLACCQKEKKEERGSVIGNNETYNEVQDGPLENAYDIAKEPIPGDNSSAPDNSRPSTCGTAGIGTGSELPPVYSVVDKSQMSKKKKDKEKKAEDPNQLTYASLDPVLLQPDSKKMRARPKVESNYASIDLDKL